MKHFTVSCHSYESVELIIQEEQPDLQLRKSGPALYPVEDI